MPKSKIELITTPTEPEPETGKYPVTIYTDKEMIVVLVESSVAGLELADKILGNFCYDAAGVMCLGIAESLFRRRF
ncbi:hypothetical protein [Methanorbis furvi]|uniref:hypothetical protein n=1 Tax=Methanorbis furvi TaxID=3028299 RepID=UPI0030B883F0